MVCAPRLPREGLDPALATAPVLPARVAGDVNQYGLSSLGSPRGARGRVAGSFGFGAGGATSAGRAETETAGADVGAALASSTSPPLALAAGLTALGAGALALAAELTVPGWPHPA